MENTIEANSFGCTNCGADLKFKPGTTHLNCDYCGTENEIPQINEPIQEFDFNTFLSKESSSLINWLKTS